MTSSLENRDSLKPETGALPITGAQPSPDAKATSSTPPRYVSNLSLAAPEPQAHVSKSRLSPTDSFSFLLNQAYLPWAGWLLFCLLDFLAGQKMRRLNRMHDTSMRVPFLGRLKLTEYAALIGSFLLVSLEATVRVLTLALPASLLTLFYRLSRQLFHRFSSPEQKKAAQRRKSISTRIRHASDFVDLCAEFGYTAEEHVVQTKDGYLLGLHRLAWRKGEEDSKINRGLDCVEKRVVYLHHGLLMNSEVWVCLTDAKRTLPFALVNRGFDVWLGNNRGNKYSKKSIHFPPTSLEFWDFSIDEFAFHDIPDSIEYILDFTGQNSLSYIGFSQGTAQAFAALSIHPKLNEKVNVFIALAPAMSPAGLSNGIVDTLVKASPQVLYLLFGRRAILGWATFWQSVLYPPIFLKAIDFGLGFLFNWKAQNISMSQKLAAYPHLYSFTSTKSVVHWFQIIRTKSFQMYDDDVHPVLATTNKFTKVARYPTRNIKTPTVLVYGGCDSLVDIGAMMRELPPQTVATEIPHYEHLDFLWARDVDELVFPHVFDALDSFIDAEHSKEEYERYRSVRHTSIGASRSLLEKYGSFRKSSEEEGGAAESEGDSPQGARSNGEKRLVGHGDDAELRALLPSSVTATPTRAASNARESQIPLLSSRRSRLHWVARKRSTRGSSVVLEDMGDNADAGASSEPSEPNTPTGTTSGAHPTGGGTDGLHDAESLSQAKRMRRTSVGGSHLNLDSMRNGRGISLGASRAVGGVVMTNGSEAKGAHSRTGSSEDGRTAKRKDSLGR